MLIKNVALLLSSAYVINSEPGSSHLFSVSVSIGGIIDDCPFLSIGIVNMSNSDSESLICIPPSTSVIIFSLLVSYVVYIFGGYAKGVLVIFTPSSIFFSLRIYTIF
jgi:hypothetical protein